MPSFNLEKNISQEYKTEIIAGIDEVGYGAWAGPVVACAFVFFEYNSTIPWVQDIKDSKQLSKKKRQLVFDRLQQLKGINVEFAIGRVEAPEIDSINIANAASLAMLKAINNLPLKPQHLLIDGCRQHKNITIPTTMVVKGDQQSYSIAAASIIAKVYRDQVMQQLDQKFPFYNWQNNVGYGTSAHVDGLKKNGATIQHRLSYKPILSLKSMIATS